MKVVTAAITQQNQSILALHLKNMDKDTACSPSLSLHLLSTSAFFYKENFLTGKEFHSLF